MNDFTPYSALAGGMLIGLSAASLLFLIGRVAGISGILATVLTEKPNTSSWQIYFLMGLVISPLLTNLASILPPGVRLNQPLPVIVISGLLVGYGSRLGSGCTSGHAVCGLARLSKRSIAATVTFMLVAFITVFVANNGMGI